MTTRGLQRIIDTAEAIVVSRPKMISQMVTRSGRIRRVERESVVPFQFTISPCRYSKYEDVRDLIEGITIIDRSLISYVQLNDIAAMDYIVKYRGEMNTTQVNALRVSGTTSTCLANGEFDTSYTLGGSNRLGGSFITTTTNFDYMVLTNLPSLGSTTTNTTTFVSSSTVLFRAGDWVQFRTAINNGVETVDRGLARTVPLDVVRGTGTTVQVPLHRRFVFSNTATYTQGHGRAGADISVGGVPGNGMTFPIVITKMPNYKLIPGGLVEWTGDFELYEVVSG
jgi:hypothetical protein